MKSSVASLSLVLALSACATPPTDPPADGASVFDGGSTQGLQLAQDLAWKDLSSDLSLVPGVRELKVENAQVDSVGMAHVRYQQTVGGVPVWGGEAIVHLARNGSLFRVTDNAIRNLQVDTTPAYTAGEAIDLALAAYGARSDFSEAPSAQLWILRTDDGTFLTWKVRIRRHRGHDHARHPGPVRRCPRRHHPVPVRRFADHRLA